MRENMVLQGYFLSGGQASAIQGRRPPGPREGKGGQRGRPLSYSELTVQAHQRSSGLPVQSFGSRHAFVVPPHLASFGRRAGQKLPPAVRQKMESFFSADFSDVQVHSGPEASSIGALAFTQGANIYFAPGQYNPNSHFGQALLAHELTHVVQQRAGRVRNPFGSGIAVVQDPTLEAEAERMGRQAAMHVSPVQARMAERQPRQKPSSVNLSGPMKVRDGSYKITAQDKGRPVGSVMVHKRGRAVEVTDLGVEAGHRGRGFGERLIGSALRTGLSLGLKRVKLDVGDKGTGKLTKWYRQMGFRQTGLDQRGRPHMEAPIRRVLSEVAQGRMASHASMRVLQRMEEGVAAVAEGAEEDLGRGKRKRTTTASELAYVNVGEAAVKHINAKTDGAGGEKAGVLDVIAQRIVNARPVGTFQATNVVAVGMDARPRYVVAMNDFQPGEVVAALGAENGQWVREEAGGDGLHAEMRIVEGGTSRSKAIGISKLCCPPCARALQIVGKDFTGCHGQYFDKWAFPTFLTGSAANMKAFLGDTAYAQFKDWSPGNQRGFIQYLSAHMATLNKPLKKKKKAKKKGLE